MGDWQNGVPVGQTNSIRREQLGAPRGDTALGQFPPPPENSSVSYIVAVLGKETEALLEMLTDLEVRLGAVLSAATEEAGSPRAPINPKCKVGHDLVGVLNKVRDAQERIATLRYRVDL